MLWIRLFNKTLRTAKGCTTLTSFESPPSLQICRGLRARGMASLEMISPICNWIYPLGCAPTLGDREIPDTLITRTATRERINEQDGVSWWSGFMRSRCEWACACLIAAAGKNDVQLLLLLCWLCFAVVAVVMVDGWRLDWAGRWGRLCNSSSYLLYCPTYFGCHCTYYLILNYCVKTLTIPYH